MKYGGILLSFVILSLTTTRSAKALATDSANGPYEGIVERNVFNLHPAPPNVPPPPPAVPPPKITLTGITTILGGVPRALLTADVPAKPPEKAKEESYILTIGQRDGDIEVLAIDEKAGTVKVNNHGTVQTLDFVNNGAKYTAPALPLGAPPAAQLTVLGRPPTMPGQNAFRTIPSRIPRVGNSSAPVPSATASIPGYGAPALPAGQAPVSAESQFHNTMTPEEQTIIIEAKRLQLQNEGNNQQAQLFPITALTPDAQSQTPAPPTAPLPQ